MPRDVFPTARHLHSKCCELGDAQVGGPGRTQSSYSSAVSVSHAPRISIEYIKRCSTADGLKASQQRHHYAHFTRASDSCAVVMDQYGAWCHRAASAQIIMCTYKAVPLMQCISSKFVRLLAPNWGLAMPVLAATSRVQPTS